MEKEASWASSQATVEQQEGQPEAKKEFLKKTEWALERLQDKYVPTQKYEDTEECSGWRNIT